MDAELIPDVSRKLGRKDILIAVGAVLLTTGGGGVSIVTVVLPNCRNSMFQSVSVESGVPLSRSTMVQQS